HLRRRESFRPGHRYPPVETAEKPVDNRPAKNPCRQPLSLLEPRRIKGKPPLAPQAQAHLPPPRQRAQLFVFPGAAADKNPVPLPLESPKFPAGPGCPVEEPGPAALYFHL